MSDFLLEFSKIVIFPVILLLLQNYVTVRPLKKVNADLQKRLDSYSNDLIDEYINLLKDEQNNHKRAVESFSLELEEVIAQGPYGKSEDAYWDYQSHINEIEGNINHATRRIKEIPLEILDFIKTHSD